MNRNVPTVESSRMHAFSVTWRQCREFLPPHLRGRGGEGGGNILSICGHPPPCPSPARGEGTLWRCPSQRESRNRVRLLFLALGLCLAFRIFLTPSHAAHPHRRVASVSGRAHQLVAGL